MAGEAELHGVGHFQRGVKTTPQDNAGKNTDNE